jgi:hypothetical protein
MAERVEIMVVAQDAASQVLRGLTSNFGALGNMVQGITSGGAVVQLTEQFIKFGKESVEATVKYADEVRSLQLISGESAESTSRFIQVLDDYKISAQDAMAATRAMTKEGLTPNLQTLAELSDEYLSINDKQKQNEFIIKHLGRAGLQWVEVLNKGSAALLAQGEAIDDSLILTQKAVDDARRYEIALDNWNDSVQALKISIGQELLPVLTDLTQSLSASQRAQEILGEEYNASIIGTQKWNDALAQAKAEQDAAADAMLKNAEATKILGEETEKTKEQLKAEEDAVKALTKANEEYLSLVGSLADNLTDYEQKHNDIQRELDEGNITLEEAQSQWQQLADEQEKATYRMMLSMLQQQLSIDGLDAAETQFLLQQGLQWGIYSQAAVTQAQEVMRNVDALVAKYRSIPANISTNITTNYFTRYSSGPNAGLSATGGGRAGGGGVSAGELYRVNETRTEYFRPSMSGEVIPIGRGRNGGGGGSVVIQYSPMISLADESEVQTRLLPAIIKGVQVARSNGQI